MAASESELHSRRSLYLGRFRRTPPFFHAMAAARRYGCDVAIPNGPGIGDVVCFTRLLEEMAFAKGRPLRVLTQSLGLMQGPHPRDSHHPILEHNPFVGDLVAFESGDEESASNLIREKDNVPQFGHIIENTCRVYGLRPRKTIGSLFLSKEEVQVALEMVRPLKRPLICLHPGGKSSSLATSTWYLSRWRDIIELLSENYGLFQVGRQDVDRKNLDVPTFDTNLREAMALIRISDIFLGFDSGPHHIAAAFEIPSIVLWDAPLKSILEEEKEPGFAFAALMRWSYPQNRNILVFEQRDEEIVQDIIETIRTLTHRSSLLEGQP